MTQDAGPPIESVDRALRLVSMLRDEDSITVTHAAETLGVALSTAHRLLGALAYLSGAVASAGAGFVGMRIATSANARTAEAARTGGVHAALPLAFRGGAVMGFSVAGLGLLGIVILYVLLVQALAAGALRQCNAMLDQGVRGHWAILPRCTDRPFCVAASSLRSWVLLCLAAARIPATVPSSACPASGLIPCTTRDSVHCAPVTGRRR